MNGTGRSRAIYRHLGAALAALLVGGSLVATRVLSVQVDPAALAFLRILLAAICLLPFAWMIWRAEPLSRRDLLQVLVVSVLLFGLTPWLFNLSLSMTTASRGAIAFGTAPLFAVLFWHALQFRALDTVKIAALAVTTIGCVLAFAGGSEAQAVAGAEYQVGDLVMLAAAALCGGSVMAAKPILDRAPVLMVVGVGLTAGAVALIVPVVLPFAQSLASGGETTGLPQITNSGLLLLLFLGIPAGSVMLILFLWAADGIRLLHFSWYLVLVPVFGLALAVGLLGEPLAVSLLIGLVLLAAGILAILWRPRPQRRERRGIR